MRHHVLALMLALMACEHQDGRSDVVPIHALEGLPGHTERVLDGASEILGLALVGTETRPGGAIVLVRVDQPSGGFDGHTDWVSECSPIVWSVNEAQPLAHELGHALGLEHETDPDNLMHATGNGEDLADEQVDRMRAWAWDLQHECP